MITEKQAKEFSEATKVYQELKIPIAQRATEIARSVCDLLVWKKEKVMEDSEAYGDVQTYEDGLGNIIQDVSVEGENTFVTHWYENCMAYLDPLTVSFPSEYLWNQEKFHQEIGIPLKVFEDEFDKK